MREIYVTESNKCMLTNQEIHVTESEKSMMQNQRKTCYRMWKYISANQLKQVWKSALVVVAKGEVIAPQKAAINLETYKNI